MRILLLFALAVVAAGSTVGQEPPKEFPKEWIDPDTGHRVVRLTDEQGSQSLYFHQNPYTIWTTGCDTAVPAALHSIRAEDLFLSSFPAKAQRAQRKT